MRIRCSLVFGAAVVGLSLPASAADGIPFTIDPIQFNATLDASAGAMSVRNAQFGQGSTSRTGQIEGGRTWYEGYVKPGLDFEWAGDGHGSIYGGLSFVAAATRGAGEPVANSTTSDQPEHVGLEKAMIGWRSGTVFDWAPTDAFDLSLGNQEFTLGDGFLIANGTADGARRGALYLGPRATFEKTVILRANTDPVRVDLFHLSGTVDQVLMRGGDNPDTRLYGANIEWFESKDSGRGRFDYDERLRYVGLTALKVYEADRAYSFSGSQGGGVVNANRDGLEVVSARFGGSFIPDLDDLSLYGEWGIERNDDGSTGGRVRASAWYLQPQYNFSALPWTPTLTARYAHFSGDKNTGDRVDRSWDPLFSDAGPRGSQTWVQGLIYGNYIGSNSNLNSLYAGAEVVPIDDVLRIGLAFYRHEYDHPSQAGASAKHLMDEVDLYAEWSTPVPGLSLAPGFAMGRSGQGQREALGIAPGDARTIWLGQVVLAYRF